VRSPILEAHTNHSHACEPLSTVAHQVAFVCVCVCVCVCVLELLDRSAVVYCALHRAAHPPLTATATCASCASDESHARRTQLPSKRLTIYTIVHVRARAAQRRSCTTWCVATTTPRTVRPQSRVTLPSFRQRSALSTPRALLPCASRWTALMVSVHRSLQHSLPLWVVCSTRLSATTVRLVFRVNHCSHRSMKRATCTAPPPSLSLTPHRLLSAVVRKHVVTIVRRLALRC